MNCPHCGAPNVFGVSRCEYCGSTLPELPKSEVEIASKPQRPSIKIEIPARKKTKQDHLDDFIDGILSMFSGSCWSVFGLIFCFPLMLTITAFSRRTSFMRWLYGVIAFIGWIIYLGLGIGVLMGGDSADQALPTSVAIRATQPNAPSTDAVRSDAEDQDRAELIRTSCALRLSNRKTLSIADPDQCPIKVRIHATRHAQTVRLAFSADDHLAVIPLVLDYIHELSIYDVPEAALTEFAELMHADGSLFGEGEARFGLKITRQGCADPFQAGCSMSITIQKPNKNR